MTPIRYLLGIDVESTGGCLKTNFMPRFGAALVDIETLETVQRFSTFVKPPTPAHTWEKRCLDEFWTKPDMMPKYQEILHNMNCVTTPTPDEAGVLFMEWINILVGKYGQDSMMVVSDTAGYDYAWLQSILPAGMSMLYLFGHYVPTFAASNFYGGVAMVTPVEQVFGTMEACCNKLSIQKPTNGVVHDHNPMNDAETIAYEAASIIRHVSSLRN